jgi:hypothetical protein
MKQTLLNQSRRDKFLLVLDIPSALRKFYYIEEKRNSADTVQFTVIGSPVPVISIPSLELKHTGQSFHVSTHSRPAYTPLTVNIIIDNEFNNYWLLWSWLNLFNDEKTGMPSYQNIKNLITKFTIFVLDEYNNRIMSFKYNDVFITGMSELNFSYQEDGMITSAITFAFNQMHVERIINSELDKELDGVCLTSE